MVSHRGPQPEDPCKNGRHNHTYQYHDKMCRWRVWDAQRNRIVACVNEGEVGKTTHRRGSWCKHHAKAENRKPTLVVAH